MAAETDKQMAPYSRTAWGRLWERAGVRHWREGGRIARWRDGEIKNMNGEID